MLPCEDCVSGPVSQKNCLNDPSINFFRVPRASQGLGRRAVTVKELLHISSIQYRPPFCFVLHIFTGGRQQGLIRLIFSSCLAGRCFSLGIL